MRKFSTIAFALLLVCAFASVSKAQTTVYWMGLTDNENDPEYGNWDVAADWSTGVVPDLSSDTVIINSYDYGPDNGDSTNVYINEGETYTVGTLELRNSNEVEYPCALTVEPGGELIATEVDLHNSTRFQVYGVTKITTLNGNYSAGPCTLILSDITGEDAYLYLGPNTSNAIGQIYIDSDGGYVVLRANTSLTIQTSDTGQIAALISNGQITTNSGGTISQVTNSDGSITVSCN